MPIDIAVLREHVRDDTDEDITVYLHTGDPDQGGAAGTANRVPTASIGSATITATTGWNYHATLARATAAADVMFGDANAAVAGVSWYSLFKGAVKYATRQLATSMDVANGSAVILTGSTVVVEYTSIDT